tara:strand:+ start:989 stop:1171 length:183 start_codon:yes stop_codon:yes gene_type:complete
MKKLNLNQMENVQAGELTSCELALLVTSGAIILGVFAPWSYLMMGGLALDAVGLVGSCLN